MGLLDEIFAQITKSSQRREEMSVSELRDNICKFRFDTKRADSLIRELEEAGKIEWGKRRCKLMLAFAPLLLYVCVCWVGLIYFFA